MPRTSQRFSIAKGENLNVADSDTQGVEFRRLRNCYPDQRIGALLKRRGSLTETLTTGLGIPLGIGEQIEEDSEELLPIKSVLLANFAGTDFYKRDSGAWSSVGIDANTSFSTTKTNSFARYAENLYIAGGRPAKWTGGTADVDRVGIPAHATALTLGLSGTGLTGIYAYRFTFYDSVTGLESDYNPVATITATDDTIDVSGIPATAPHTGTDTIRLYRTQAEGELFFLLTSLALGTTVYADSVSDTTLVLTGIRGPRIGEFATPPNTSFICGWFQARLWWVDGANPYIVRYSKPFVTSLNDLEYYPTENILQTDEPVTGIHVTPNRMLFFHPRSVSFVSGFSNNDFRHAPFFQGVGTLFNDSIASDGTNIVFLAEEGWVELTPNGKRNISKLIEPELKDLLNQNYNASLFSSTAWSPALRQYLFFFSARGTGVPWVTEGTGAVANWVDADTGAAVEWEDVGAPASVQTTRVKVWGYSPELQLWTEYDFGQVTDLNNVSAYITTAITPLPTSDALNPTQDKTFVAFFDGTEGKVMSINRRDMAQDDAAVVQAEWLTGRITPGDADGSFKRIHSVDFSGDYSDPTETGTLQYLQGFEDPHIRSFITELRNFTKRGDLQVPEFGRMKFIHLYGTDSSNVKDKVLLTDFRVNFRERFSKQGR